MSTSEGGHVDPYNPVSRNVGMTSQYKKAVRAMTGHYTVMVKAEYYDFEKAEGRRKGGTYGFPIGSAAARRLLP